MIKQGLRSLSQASPSFSNQDVQNAIAEANIGFVAKTKELQYLVDVNSVLTDVQKGTVRASLNLHPYLNIGRYLLDLDNHTFNILDGSLGESDPNDTTGPTFLEHLGAVDGIQGMFLALYGEEASTDGKGVDDYFGTLRGVINNDLSEIKEAVQGITAFGLAADTGFQTATQTMIDFVYSLGDGDSTTVESALPGLLSAFESAANNFNAALTATALSGRRDTLIAARIAIVDQIAVETANLGSIRTYSESLAQLATFQTLAGDIKIREVIFKTAQNSAWKDYYGNYESRLAQLKIKYENTTGDSDNSAIIENELRQRGLPDVTDYVNLQAVAEKASRDTRLITTVSFPGRSIAEVIRRSCEQLRINITGRDIYGQSQALLENMNNHDRDTIKLELENHQRVNTLS